MRAAVESRDTALIAVGEGVRRLSEGATPEPELAAFAQNISRFEAEAGSLDAMNTSLRTEAERARGDVDAAVRAFDQRLAAVRGEAAPQEQALAQLLRQTDDLARQHAAFTTRQSRSPDPGVAADLARNEQKRAEISAEVARLDTIVTQLRRQADALTDEQAATRKAGDRQVQLLLSRAEKAATDARQMQGRQRATLMDLGHEALRRGLSHPDLAEPAALAKAEIAALEAARTHRELILAERRQIDLAPCLRTLAGAAVVLGGLFTLILAW